MLYLGLLVPVLSSLIVQGISHAKAPSCGASLTAHTSTIVHFSRSLIMLQLVDSLLDVSSGLPAVFSSNYFLFGLDLDSICFSSSTLLLPSILLAISHIQLLLLRRRSSPSFAALFRCLLWGLTAGVSPEPPPLIRVIRPPSNL